MGWGNSVCVRRAFLETVGQPVIFDENELQAMDYPPHAGDAKLIELTRKVIERQVGPTYRHIFIVNGATGGVTIALRMFAQKGCQYALTRSPPWFPIYPSMIKSAGLKHGYSETSDAFANPVTLIDSPINPTGEVLENVSFATPLIWDAVYHSRVYTSGNYKPLQCDILVGSYSKLLGLNAIRTGWIATNDDLLAVRLKDLVTAEYCGISGPSTSILLELLSDLDAEDWNDFEFTARIKLDYNREMWSKLTKYFGDVQVSPNGMFYYGPMDMACQKLLTKSGITWTTGESLGATNDFGRINLGQDCLVVCEAVRQVIKNDKI